MVDKIKPLKIESVVGGGDNDNLFPTETDPSQDYASLKGVAFAGADNRLIDLNASGQLQMTDARVTNHLIPRTASEVDFNNATNGFTATQSQAAIEEARNTALGTVRYCAACGFDGTASLGRFLEFSANNPSDTSPHVVAEPGLLKSLSVGMAGTSTTTFTVYKNTTTVLATLSTSGTAFAHTDGLNVALVASDRISVKVTAGSSSKPVFNVFIQVT